MSRNIFYSLLFLLFLFSTQPAKAEILEDLSSATVYAYFHITDDNDDDSSLSFSQFTQQVEEIGDGNYTVLSIDELLAAEELKKELPPNTIVLTFDDPDRDTYATAFPLLIDKNIPFTIFVSPGNTDEKEWARLRTLRKNPLVTIGLSSHTYAHLGSWSEQRLTQDVNKAKSIFREKMDEEALYFAYPFGEYTDAFVNVISKSGFRAAFGQNSGVVTTSMNNLKLPRFTMTDDYGNLERFRTTSNALPFPVKDIQPAITYVTSFPSIGFTVDDRISNDLKNLNCFASGGVQPKTTLLGSGRVEIRFDEQPTTERLRINCTITVPGEIAEDDPRYRWLAFLLHFPTKPVVEETGLSPLQP